jgi:triphosphoribosyl-dephospho-CoA synthetase
MDAFSLSPAAIGRLARRAALLEASAAPKPGLVCPERQGAHPDMEYADFVASAASLEPYFGECAALGRGKPEPRIVLDLLRPGAIRAEQAMLAATGGVNTHKGLIFSLGLICAAYGRLAGEPRPPGPDGVNGPDGSAWARLLATEAAGYARGIVERELAPLRLDPPARRLTAGERLYLEHRVTGIRGEAERGFPTALRAFGLLREELRQELARPAPDLVSNQILPHALLRLMAETEDTNILHRGGREGLRFVQDQALSVLRRGGMRTAEGRAAMLRFCAACARRRLSPGGCADMLVVGVFFHLALPGGDQNSSTWPRGWE